MPRLNSLVAGLVLSCVTATCANAQNCVSSCSIRQPADAEQSIQVDVTHPKIAGSLQFPEGTAVEVILYNKNPFRFEYTVDTTTQFVDRTTVKELLPLLGFPSFDKLLAESTQAEDKVESDAAAAAKFAAGARPPAPS